MFAEALPRSLALTLAATTCFAAAADPACQCDGATYWCTTTSYLRWTYNCSGSQEGRELWKKISGNEAPSKKDCHNMATRCDGNSGAHASSAANRTCDDSCYDFCWKKPVGDCADDDDAQIFCVGQCMAYCTATKCAGSSRPAGRSECQKHCSSKHMETGAPDFVSYSNCMGECAPVPYSPYGSSEQVLV
eukprot:TRINITY_DN10754_c0_g1_i1.p1 TRINITY_DN10754_c0_g1~~TRINITY_DN10754_c0_g1_i1.p1  ORF type:complete len:211 (-),score=28.70 TRINITY_DN10754_c0_g1_i1:75-644(-)